MNCPTKTFLVLALLSRLAVTRTNASSCHKIENDEPTLWDVSTCIRQIILEEEISQQMMQKCLLGCFFMATGFMGQEGNIKFHKFEEVVKTQEEAIALKLRFYHCFQKVTEDRSLKLVSCEAAYCLEQLEPVRDFIASEARKNNQDNLFYKDKSRTPPYLQGRKLQEHEAREAIVSDIRRMVSNSLQDFLYPAKEDAASSETTTEGVGIISYVNKFM
ncbi:uncharacterized protein LOC106657098 [Trichogramma pretiosum]|uniref:uncharacterized protein LOC106657098 n=1 Tax=Trichogramma pretiosum TaxID=7493 RepID=UPI0006C9B134|nr:uncharacterized protein LOC106657098 [Trichogramma pretiosum]